jgi:RHS repeat-associated protein
MDVYYEYGDPTAGNQAGRITRMQDASGVQEFSYGKLGEVIENVRTFVLPGASETYTFKMEWEYDSWNRIKQMTYPDGEVVSYGYDAASNIVAIGNSASALPNGLGGTYFNLYSYDSLYRLTSSQSWFSDYQSNPYSRTTQMQYSASGNIISKSVNASLLLDGAVVNKNYTHQYTYNTAQPHTLASMGNSTFHWDFNGNMTRHDDRVLYWDEENRLGSARDPGHLAAYLYNAGGARVWKFTGDVSQMGQSGKTVIEQVSLNNKTLYASSFFVASDHGYTKHYFAGSERVCSKLGGGLLLAPVMPTEATVEAIFEDYEQMRNRLFDLINKFANCNPHPEQQTVTYIDIEPYLGGIQDYLDRHEPEENRFFYHPDHLGSSNFITDAAGDGYQHLQYLPFGETAVSQKVSWWSTPYQFTGKEKDDETGYNYFGARYYNSDLSVWLSVDPMSDKAPSWSPYRYCFQNPLNITDPIGFFEKKSGAKWYRFWHSGTLKNSAIVYDEKEANYKIQTVDGRSIWRASDKDRFADLDRDGIIVAHLVIGKPIIPVNLSDPHTNFLDIANMYKYLVNTKLPHLHKSNELMTGNRNKEYFSWSTSVVYYGHSQIKVTNFGNEHDRAAIVWKKTFVDTRTQEEQWHEIVIGSETVMKSGKPTHHSLIILQFHTNDKELFINTWRYIQNETTSIPIPK